jgi:hypothetical protein
MANSFVHVVAGLVPPVVPAPCFKSQGRREKPGDDASRVIQIDRIRLISLEMKDQAALDHAPDAETL